MTSTVPVLGIESTSIRLMNRTSLFEMVSGVSLPSRFTRRDGTLRLISTVCIILETGTRTSLLRFGKQEPVSSATVDNEPHATTPRDRRRAHPRHRRPD